MSNGNETDTKGEVTMVPNLQVQALMGELRRIMREELEQIHERLDRVEDRTQRRQNERGTPQIGLNVPRINRVHRRGVEEEEHDVDSSPYDEYVEVVGEICEANIVEIVHKETQEIEGIDLSEIIVEVFSTCIVGVDDVPMLGIESKHEQDDESPVFDEKFVHYTFEDENLQELQKVLEDGGINMAEEFVDPFWEFIDESPCSSQLCKLEDEFSQARENGVEWVDSVKVQEITVESVRKEFQDDRHYEDPFYPMISNNSSDSWLLKKIIINYFILTRWTDWMDVCVKIGVRTTFQIRGRIPFQERGNDVNISDENQQARLTNDPMHIPIGPVMRARARRFKDALNNFTRRILQQGEEFTMAEGEGRLVTCIEVDQDSVHKTG